MIGRRERLAVEAKLCACLRWGAGLSAFGSTSGSEGWRGEGEFLFGFGSHLGFDFKKCRQPDHLEQVPGPLVSRCFD